MLTPKPIGAGSRFRGEFKRVGTVAWTTIELDLAERVVNRGSAKFYQFTSTLIFAPKDGGTAVTGRLQLEPRGPFKLITPLLAPMMRKKFLGLLEQFKQWAEAPAIRA